MFITNALCMNDVIFNVITCMHYYDSHVCTLMDDVYSLGENGIGNKGCEWLGQMLQRNAKLQTLE
jgi:hypothetical protein